MFLDLLKEESNKTFTENGAVTLETSNSNCLDLFAMIGALRNESNEKRIINLFANAYIEDKDIATKILFYARDIRGGLGERRVFRIISKWLANNYPDTIKKNLIYFNEFGRWDDLFSLFDTKCETDMLKYISKQFANDITSLLDKNDKTTSLLGKWMPSINASNDNTIKCGKKIAKAFNLSYKEYRKILTKLRKKINIIENYLREKDYSFDYSKIPSNAMFKYKNAFIKNDNERYTEFLKLVQEGKKRLLTKNVYPYQIVREIINNIIPIKYRDEPSDDKINAWNTTWNQLEDFTDNKNSIVVMDGSGSMHYEGNGISPISVAMSLAIYFAERNKGKFSNHFITFSTNPRMVKILGKNIYEKVRYCLDFNEVANTNIEKVFKLILDTAIKNKVPQEELPETIYLITDIEWDYCANNSSLTNFENAKTMFEKAGYKLPKLVFWNVDSRNNQVPVKKNEVGVALVSGCSPRTFSMVLNDKMDPYTYMMEILNNERYLKIVA